MESPVLSSPWPICPWTIGPGLSVTGLIRSPGGVRVGTHTLLMDRAVFQAMNGFPLGLFAPGSSGVEPADWFPDFRSRPVGRDGGLEPLTVPAVASRDAFRSARVSAVSSLAGWVAGRMGEATAVHFLASVYQALARASEAGALVSLDPGDGDVGDRAAWVRNIMLLAWLSLPLADRYQVYFSSDGTGSSFARPLLVGGDVRDDGSSATLQCVGVSLGSPAAPRFMEWARCVFGGATAFGPVSKRTDVRGQSLLSERVAVVMPRAFPATPAALAALVREEMAGPGRGGALGSWVTRFLCEASERDQARAARDLSEIPHLLDLPRFADGFVRGSRRDPAALLRTREGARLAVAAGTRSGRRATGIDLAVRGLAVLIEGGDGASELRAMVETAYQVDGPVAGAELWRVGLGLLRRHGRQETLPSYVALLGRLPGAAAAPGVADDLADMVGGEARVARSMAQPGSRRDNREEAPLEASARERDDRGDWFRALALLWQALADHGADPSRFDLHRLAWRERQAFGRTALASLPPSPASRRFVSAFLDRDPALPVFLELRRSPVGLASESEVAS